MATNTTNYGFKKPDESDFYDVQDQNNNWDLADGALKELDAPTFEDYTGETEVPAAATALENIKSKGKLATLLSNIKAFCKGCITLAMLVNDTATNNSQLPVSSAVTHDLQQQLNVLNTNKLTKGSLFVAVVSAPYNAEPGESEASVSCTRDGYTELGIVGFSGLTANCIGRQFFLSEGKACITIHNKGTSIQTGTCNIRVLYRAN